jgi:hypothetical protein
MGNRRVFGGQSLMVRKALKNIDPWKTVTKIREANQDIDVKKLEKDIADSVKAVRKKSRSKT